MQVSPPSNRYPRQRRRLLADIVELLSSMRFAISLLTLIAIAAVIGTVLKQGEPMVNYVNQFGSFWFEIFDRLNLYGVYSATWFLSIMGFLVVSTSLCLIRNAPKMLKDMRSWRDHVREQSLRHFHHRVEWKTDGAAPAVAQSLSQKMKAAGYRYRLIEKGPAFLLTAKRGLANKWGYIFAHSAIVIICIGGLLDSDLPIRWQTWWSHKTPFMGNGVIAQIPAQHRLSLNNPTFRGNTRIPEGASSSTAIIAQKNGVLIQDLPFTISLKRFIIDYYSTGMPKLFASEVVVTDHQNGRTFPATIKVNQPLIYQGIAVYQSSFEDGGSKLKVTAHAMQTALPAELPLQGEVGESTALPASFLTSSSAAVAPVANIEWSDFRAFNIENMVQKAPVASLDWRSHIGSAAKNANTKDFKNLGPSIQYKLRDKNGQAQEYNNYMQSMIIDGDAVFLTGVRVSPGEPFNYLRIPADDNDSVTEWMRLRAAIQNPVLREQAAQRYAQVALSEANQLAAQERAALRQQLQQAAAKNLALFAGSPVSLVSTATVKNDGANSSRQVKSAGYSALSLALAKLPSTEQEKAAQVLMKVLNNTVWELWQQARLQAGLPALPTDEKHRRFLQLSLNAISDAFFYPAPVYIQLNGFDEVKASVLQVTRTPGKKVVYLGCLLLVLGVFSMFYNRERRVWIWIKPTESGNTNALMAMSTHRKTLDFEHEFEALKLRLMQENI